MGWVRDSDQVLEDEALWEADIAGYTLWSASMRVCAAKGEGAGGDGLLSPKDIHAALHKFKTPIKAGVGQKLVELGLWHDATTLRRCGECRELSGGSLPSPEHRYIHDWKEHLQDEKGRNDKLHRALDTARRALRTGKDREMAADVRRRDTDECQYCGILTRWPAKGDKDHNDRKSADLGEYDHVNPFATVLNTKDNVAVSCKGCNSDKKQRNPAQWAASGGLLLRRAPGSTTDPTWVDQAQITDPGVDQHGEITDPDAPINDAITDAPRVTRDSGPSRDPGRVDPGSGPTDHGSGMDPGPGPFDDESGDR